MNGELKYKTEIIDPATWLLVDLNRQPGDGLKSVKDK
jgi:hypothetical protein